MSLRCSVFSGSPSRFLRLKACSSRGTRRTYSRKRRTTCQVRVVRALTTKSRSIVGQKRQHMKFTIVTALAITPLLTSLLAMDAESAKAAGRVGSGVSEVMATPDKGIPQEILDNAHCIVIVSGLKTGAFILGGKYGKGYLSCRSTRVCDCRSKAIPTTWAAPTTISRSPNITSGLCATT